MARRRVVEFVEVATIAAGVALSIAATGFLILYAAVREITSWVAGR